MWRFLFIPYLYLLLLHTLSSPPTPHYNSCPHCVWTLCYQQGNSARLQVHFIAHTVNNLARMWAQQILELTSLPLQATSAPMPLEMESKAIRKRECARAQRTWMYFLFFLFQISIGNGARRNGEVLSGFMNKCGRPSSLLPIVGIALLPLQVVKERTPRHRDTRGRL